MIEYRKIHQSEATTEKMQALKSQGWEVVSVLENKTTINGEVKKDHIIRLSREAGASDDSVFLRPRDIIKRFKL